MDELEINNVLSDLKMIFVDYMKRYGLETSNLVKKTTFKFQDNSIIMLSPDYAEFVDEGRGSGKMPPIKDIIFWIQEKNIRVPAGTSIEQLAFAIAKTISKKGTKAKPFLEEINKEFHNILTRYIYNTINKKLMETILFD